jgi:hypothetical protein
VPGFCFASGHFVMIWQHFSVTMIVGFSGAVFVHFPPQTERSDEA